MNICAKRSVSIYFAISVRFGEGKQSAAMKRKIHEKRRQQQQERQRHKKNRKHWIT